jgi:hypothetical protein
MCILRYKEKIVYGFPAEANCAPFFSRGIAQIERVRVYAMRVITNEAITMIAIAAKIICCMRMLRRCLLFDDVAFLPLRDIGDSSGHDTMGFR